MRSLLRIVRRSALGLAGVALVLAPAVASAQTADEENAQVTLRILAPLELSALPMLFNRVVAGAPKTVLTTSASDLEGYAGMLYIAGNPDLPIRVQFASIPAQLLRDGDPASPANERLALATWTARIERSSMQFPAACGAPGNVTPTVLGVVNVTLTAGEPYAALCVGATVTPPPTLRSGMYYVGEGWGANPGTPEGLIILVSYEM